MTRKPGPKSPCPTCGRLVGSYHAATGPIRTVRHMTLGPNAIRAHKAIGANWCQGGIVEAAPSTESERLPPPVR